MSTIFLGGAYFCAHHSDWLASTIHSQRLQNTIIWSSALLLSLPFLIATYRKLHVLSAFLAEIHVGNLRTGPYTETMRRLIAGFIPVIAMVGILFLLAALSASILPPLDLLIGICVAASLLTALLWQWFIRLHAKLQIALAPPTPQTPGEQ